MRDGEDGSNSGVENSGREALLRIGHVIRELVRAWKASQDTRQAHEDGPTTMLKTVVEAKTQLVVRSCNTLFLKGDDVIDNTAK